MAKKNNVWDHIEKINREMGEVKTDISWIKEKLEKVEQRTWYILSGVIISIILALAKLFI